MLGPDFRAGRHDNRAAAEMRILIAASGRDTPAV